MNIIQKIIIIIQLDINIPNSLGGSNPHATCNRAVTRTFHCIYSTREMRLFLPFGGPSIYKGKGQLKGVPHSSDIAHLIILLAWAWRKQKCRWSCFLNCLVLGLRLPAMAPSPWIGDGWISKRTSTDLSVLETRIY